MTRPPHSLLTALLCLCAAPAAAADGPRDWGGADRLYLQVLSERIRPRWTAFLAELRRLDARYQDQSLQAEVVISIAPDGTLRNLQYTRHAPLKGFDDAPADLLRDLGRLPAPPAALHSDDGLVHVRWRFQRRPPGCDDRSVIERRLPLPDAIPRLVRAGRAAEAGRRLHDEIPEAERAPLLRSFVSELGRTAAAALDAEERALAAAILAHLPDGEPGLITLLSDPAAEVRVRALEALSGRPLSPVVAPALRKLLGGEERALAGLLLARLKDRSAVPALRAALEAGHRAGDSAAALKNLGDGAEAARLAGRLLENPETRIRGAEAAQALGDPRLGPALLKAYGGSEEQRVAILGALGALGLRAPGDVRRAVYRAMGDASVRVKARAMAASAAFGDRSIGLRYRLIDALPHPDPLVRSAAAAALVEVGGEEARDELLRVAAKDRSAQVKAALLVAAMAHPYPSAGTLINRLRRDPEVAQAAHITGAGATEDGEAPRRAPLLTSRVPVLTGAQEDDGRLIERLLSARDAKERLQAAAGWLALQR